MPTSIDTQQKIREIVRQDGRYKPQAYVFTLEALNYTLEQMRKRGHEGHIDGRQLLFGIREYAKKLFGFLGAAVFREWGVRSTAAFGDIVFALVEANLLSKQDSDSLDDFADVYDFEETFERTYIHT